MIDFPQTQKILLTAAPYNCESSLQCKGLLAAHAPHEDGSFSARYIMPCR